MRLTSTDYANPFRPLPIRAFNAIGRPFQRLRTPMSVDGLIHTATRRVRGSVANVDFGDDGFRAPLEVLVDSIEREARLTPIGQLIVRQRLVGALVTRARIEATIAENPEIEDVDVSDPIVIIGLQRTGTTALHRLLAADPAHRALLSWEALSPVSVKPNDEASRITNARRAQRALSWMSPDFLAVHPTDAMAPEEDIVLLDLGFASQVAEASLHVPTYSRWLEEHGQVNAYRTLRRALQVLSQDKPRRRWVLKTPNHLEQVDTVLQVFPRARLVWTHRSPTECVVSFASMVAHLRGLFSDHVDPVEVADHWLRKCHRMVERASEDRAALGSGAPIHDIDYASFIADPVTTMEALYAALGLAWTPALASAVRAASEAAPQHRHGKHVYRAEDFSLSDELIEDRFAQYIVQHLSDHT